MEEETFDRTEGRTDGRVSLLLGVWQHLYIYLGGKTNWATGIRVASKVFNVFIPCIYLLARFTCLLLHLRFLWLKPIQPLHRNVSEFLSSLSLTGLQEQLLFQTSPSSLQEAIRCSVSYNNIFVSPASRPHSLCTYTPHFHSTRWETNGCIHWLSGRLYEALLCFRVLGLKMQH